MLQPTFLPIQRPQARMQLARNDLAATLAIFKPSSSTRDAKGLETRNNEDGTLAHGHTQTHSRTGSRMKQ